MSDQDSWARHVANVARELRPEDFRPWKHPPIAGAPLVSAVFIYAPEGLHGQISWQLARADRGILDHQSMALLHAECWRFMQGRLRRGELTAKGHLHGSGDLRILAPTLFDDAQPDFSRNTIVSCGMTFGGMRVFEGLDLVSSAVEAPELRAELWMKEHVTAYLPNQRDARVKECRIALAITKDQALAGWNTLPETIKGKSRTPCR